MIHVAIVFFVFWIVPGVGGCLLFRSFFEDEPIKRGDVVICVILGCIIGVVGIMAAFMALAAWLYKSDKGRLRAWWNKPL